MVFARLEGRETQPRVSSKDLGFIMGPLVSSNIAGKSAPQYFNDYPTHMPDMFIDVYHQFITINLGKLYRPHCDRALESWLVGESSPNGP